MRFVLGGLAVAALAALLTAVPYALPPDGWLVATRIGSEFGYLVMALGGLRGALAFDRGDVLRRAWLWVSVSGTLGFLTGIVYGPPLRALPDLLATSTTGVVVSGIIDVALNITIVMGLILFARAWHETGLSPPWQKPATALAFAIGVGVAGPSLWHDVPAAFAGGNRAIGSTISDLGDIASMTLAGPLFASAVWMRGGALVGPYIYLTGYAVAWLMFDAGSLLFTGHFNNVYDMFFSTSGNLSAGLAGLTHYWVIRRRSVAKE